VYIETDIRVTRDGVVVVFHDETLERTTNGVGRVVDWDWADLSQLDAAYNFTPDGDSFPLRGKGIGISRLDDTFDTFPDVNFNIDLKAAKSEWPVADVIVSKGRFDSVLVGGFVDRRTARFHRITKGKVPVSAGPSASIAMFSASRIGRTSNRKFDAYQLPASTRGMSVDQKLVDAVHKADSHIHVWTVDDPQQMHELLDLGVDGIVTDRPDLLNEVIEERNT
jgi:glycerophosphoryl diester phosphodiesterase